PAKECKVFPPTFRAAIPVLAVTATRLCCFRSVLMISRKRTDLPVPVATE
ncbi:hypothetical protein BDV93DRAFT_446909, partial [Ceratobasidium sp. AG-I]